jgi:hypothetical protein
MLFGRQVAWHELVVDGGATLKCAQERQPRYPLPLITSSAEWQLLTSSHASATVHYFRWHCKLNAHGFVAASAELDDLEKP